MELMKTGYWVTKKQDGYWSNVGHDWGRANSKEEEEIVSELYSVFKNKSLTDDEKISKLNAAIVKISGEASAVSNLTDALKKFINFFSEFSFEPNFRFTNTIALMAKNRDKVKEYVKNYMEVSDNPAAHLIAEKMESDEFNDIIKNFISVDADHVINNRLKIYYGSQGTGKTTEAAKESGDKIMPCHSAMLPSDLMEDFKFEDGKAIFRKSSLWNAMEGGYPITLDEINLLPFESLRFLQSVLDGKKEFLYKGMLVKIADGFKVIGTMNLTVNGMTYPLPEPLVDRCSEIKKFSLTAENLLGAFSTRYNEVAFARKEG